MIDREDAQALSANPAFLRFLYSVIQSAGLLAHTVSADGRTVRDQCLEWHEGRRSLGREILQMIEQGQPDALRSPDGEPMLTLHAVLREAINPKEKPNARTRSYHAADRDDADD